jgi:hypothetical protein
MPGKQKVVSYMLPAVLTQLFCILGALEQLFQPVGGPFDGVGKFKFAIVDQTGTNTFWSNDGTSTNGVEPTAAVSLNVKGGILSVRLGDESYPNMMKIPASVFLNPDTWMRVWFGGAAGTTFEKLAPDSKLASVPYAMVAETVPDAAITGSKLARESVWPQHEGRNNTIVTYFAEYAGNTNIVLGTISTNKNYIITDVIFGSVASPDTELQADVEIAYIKNSQETILFRARTFTPSYSTSTANIPPTSVTLRSGLAVPAGATLKISGWKGYSYARTCTISGFEIPVQ